MFRRVVLSLLVALLLSSCGGQAPAVTSPPVAGNGAPLPSTGGFKFAITSHASGDTVPTRSIRVAGTGPVGERIVQDIRFTRDNETVVDGEGRWVIPVDLEVGSNELTFRVGDDENTAVTLYLTYTNDAASRPPAATSPAATPLPAPTQSPMPTRGPTPTRAPTPTPSPTPEPTPALTFNPITLTGRGDRVVRFKIPEDAIAMATIKYSGSGNFAVWTVDDGGDKTDLLVNEIGSYSGRVLFDETGHSVAFSVESSGSWTIVVNPIEKIPSWSGATTRTATGDYVLRLTGAAAETFVVLKLTHAGSSNFAVWAYGYASTDLLVNDIGRYSGEVLMGDAVLLEIHADGKWTAAVQ